MITFDGFNNINKYFYNKHIKTSIALGRFDGIHLGHKILIENVVEYTYQKKHAKSSSTVVSFFQKNASTNENNNTFLLSEDQKERAFKELGIAFFVKQRLEENFTKTNHYKFLDEFLKVQLNPEYIVVGENFKFGYLRLGDIQHLESWGIKEKIKVDIITLKNSFNQSISSSRIRELLKERGDVNVANSMLGRPYMIEGIIVKGNQIGRKLGTPTANLGKINQLIPKEGIYAGWIWLGDKQNKNNFPHIAGPEMKSVIPAVFNIGYRPTIRENSQEIIPKISVEGHLLEGKYLLDSLYDYPAVFYFTHRIRDELRFNSIEELIKNIEMDKQAALQALKNDAKINS